MIRDLLMRKTFLKRLMSNTFSHKKTFLKRLPMLRARPPRPPELYSHCPPDHAKTSRKCEVRRFSLLRSGTARMLCNGETCAAFEGSL